MIEQTIGKATFVAKPTYQDYVESDAQARRIAAELIRK
jgi:1-deoxy-D-xylulose-5-phosphate reductoisomerase